MISKRFFYAGRRFGRFQERAVMTLFGATKIWISGALEIPILFAIALRCLCSFWCASGLGCDFQAVFVGRVQARYQDRVFLTLFGVTVRVTVIEIFGFLQIAHCVLLSFVGALAGWTVSSRRVLTQGAGSGVLRIGPF